ncbi:MAG: hypothetical protein WCY19_05015 [Candidatus Gastranaerophilaceae bacterium]
MGNQQEFIAYKDGIETSLKAQFPKLNGDDIDVKVFAKFPEEEFKKPAIILGLPLMEKSSLSTQETFWLNVNNSAYIVTSVIKDTFAFEAQQLSVNLGNFIEKNTWGNKAFPANVTAILPDEHPLLDPRKCNVQRIDFTQQLQILDKN